MVREAGQMNTILLTLEFLCMFSLLAVVNLESVVCSSHYGQFPSVIEIQGGHVRLIVVRSESLYRRVSVEQTYGRK
jgi:hypothetical protein